MKILFLAHRTPYPPNKGDKIRSFHLLSQLAKRHDVTLLYWLDDPKDLSHTASLQALCRGKVFPVRMRRVSAMARAVLSLLQGRSFSEGFYRAEVFQRALDEALRAGPFDAVFAFSSAIAPYCATIDAKTKIVDFVDVDSDKWGQLGRTARFPLSTLYRIEESRLSRLEAQISAWASRSLFVSAADAALFKQRGGRGKIEVLPNGTDLDLRRLPREPMPFHDLHGRNVAKDSDAKLIFVGTMNYQPNADAVQYFVEQIFPKIRESFPSAVFEVVGRQPPKAVTRLQNHPGVRIVGEVPDVRSYLLRADVSVAPMRIARGVQNKVLEAMAMGVPVVATGAAIQGIEVADGQEVLVGENPEEFSRQVVRLLTDAELRKTIIKKASSKMAQTYNWELVGARLEECLSAAAPGASAGRSALEIHAGGL
jgi:sugar transferase (PEP-CTERM/EpsH1 system associated)